jgi:hypothetical protein
MNLPGVPRGGRAAMVRGDAAAALNCAALAVAVGIQVCVWPPR